MTQVQKIDIDLLKDKSTFDKIQEQKSIFIGIFTEIANHYPQSKLSNFHSNARGVKVSQGINLDHCPYQVLDIFRDFDLKSGFNVRILNWMGHGLYIFLQFGREFAVTNEKLIFERLSEFYSGISTDPFDYKTIIKSKESLKKENLKDHLNKFSFLVLYKEIQYETSLNDQKEVLLENINLILDKDS
ncbi:hypothetical protein [Belliella aquatica]|uniref:Uncharacterized protein n=1 Tax=Belliella aquatica TaxID=1323734 RepID=A0ABQ1M868_9BACT|nr:hypothetical protein [Belliella aquatica]MCH7405578.1 hypothetical protein [Belliella aquatica]GGC36099.1 hypothetical protein GCM10010993_13690 [Belliella aquatica]